jgi:hypothetical protein
MIRMPRLSRRYLTLSYAALWILGIPIVVFAAATIPSGCSTPGDCTVLSPTFATVTVNSLIHDSGSLIIDNGSIGIGTTTPVEAITLVGNPSAVKMIEIHNSYAVGIDMYTHADAGFRAPYFNFYKSRGSQASPQPVTLTGYETDSIGGINFGGWDGASYVTGAAIYSQSDEDWNSVGHHRGGHLSIYATQNGSNTTRQFGGLDSPDSNAHNTNGITGNIIFFAGLAFNGNQSGNPAILASSNPALLKIRNANDSADASITVGGLNASGNVGIGTTNPSAKLAVVGTISGSTLNASALMHLTPRSTAPVSPTRGDMYYDSDSNELCLYDGSSWTGLKVGGACS